MFGHPAKNSGKKSGFLMVLLFIFICITGLVYSFLSCGNSTAKPRTVIHKQYNFIENIDNGIKTLQNDSDKLISVKHIRVGDEKRRALFMHPDSGVEFKKVEINKGASLVFGIGIDENAWQKQGDGVVFSISIRGGLLNREKTIFEKYIDPKNNPDERQWMDYSLSLSKYENSLFDITFSTRGGVNNDRRSDWSAWSGLKLVSDGKKIVLKENSLERKPNIILITIDTLRADFLGCYGKDDISTPVIDGLASRSILFENAVAQSCTTNPSHSSIMTSLYPIDHGVYSNSESLSEEVLTIAEILSREGYMTAGIVGATHLNHDVSGLGQGFNVFFPCLGGQRKAQEISSTISYWIEDNCEAPFFVWMHYFDPHTPYTPPPPYSSMYYKGDARNREVDTMKEVRFPDFFLPHKLEWLDGVRDINFPIAQYMGEISYVDDSIGNILKTIENLDLTDDTIIILTADHGESMAEHKVYFNHYGLFENIIRVPLIIYNPRTGIAPKRITAIVESIDILPTILDFTELPKPNQLRGQSLTGLILGKTGKHKEIAYSEASSKLQRCIRKQDYKLIESLSDAVGNPAYMFHAGDLELYDLGKDADELTNISANNPDMVSALKNSLEEWSAGSYRLENTKEKDVSPELLEHLRSLGYLD